MDSSPPGTPPPTIRGVSPRTPLNFSKKSENVTQWIPVTFDERVIHQLRGIVDAFAELNQKRGEESKEAVPWAFAGSLAAIYHGISIERPGGKVSDIDIVIHETDETALSEVLDMFKELNYCFIKNYDKQCRAPGGNLKNSLLTKPIYQMRPRDDSDLLYIDIIRAGVEEFPFDLNNREQIQRLNLPVAPVASLAKIAFRKQKAYEEYSELLVDSKNKKKHKNNYQLMISHVPPQEPARIELPSFRNKLYDKKHLQDLTKYVRKQNVRPYEEVNYRPDLPTPKKGATLNVRLNELSSSINRPGPFGVPFPGKYTGKKLNF